MMRQYREAKEQSPDALLLFRMGDFYELFGEDAITAARELGITLTTRDKGKENPMPMAGVPYHAISSYLQRLIARGFKVAVCEQVEEPGENKGILRREIVQVVTPGTVMDTEMLNEKEKNFLGALVVEPSGGRTGPGGASTGACVGVALLEVSTGEMIVWESAFSQGRQRPRECAAEILVAAEILDRYQPAEVLYPDGESEDELEMSLRALPARRTRYTGVYFGAKEAAAALRRAFGVVSLEGFGLDDRRPGPAVRAAGALLAYVEETQQQPLSYVGPLRLLGPSEGMVVDGTTRRNLELVRTIHGQDGEGTVLHVLDRTRTPMGGRLLREWLLAPLAQVAPIRARHDAVAALLADDLAGSRVAELLGGVGDLERVIGRVCLGRATPREISLLGSSLSRLPALLQVLGGRGEALDHVVSRVDPIPELCALIATSLASEAPITARDGNVFASGFSAELDELRSLAHDGKSWILSYEAREREATGISSLKVRYNKVFGYYLEVTRSHLEKVPDDRYQRRQTLVNAERFITPELKAFEEKVLGAEERQKALEIELFARFRERVAGYAGRVRETARALAELDVLASFAAVARDRNYVRPLIDETGILEIEAGRHPVVEALAENEPFVPNDTYLDLEDHQLILLTGPNMSGKSTVLRQVALIALLAQIGAFVPARRARIGVVDRIFTRVGASDNLARGQSTFLVEMHETANICNNATRHSLVVLDEIGRGTSTFDGLSIAWAVAEYLHEAPHLGCKTLFATHYHELTELESILRRVKNYHVAVREESGRVVFMRRVERGGIDQSFGVHVAELAGLPRSIIRRAHEILGNLEASELDALGRPRRGRGRQAREVVRRRERAQQLTLFVPREHPVVGELAQVVPEELTPLQALNKLDELRRLLDVVPVSGRGRPA
ncbi:MAG: DNA mismatch repair protein MutS [Candidatus Schekmanbacteria bacterium]|nr:DNA mismatch repair protein MutS [Candidatus Schekmanbacteria bacterium]